jgi:biopolymer transport protein ExbD
MAELNQNEQHSKGKKVRANGTSRSKHRGKLSTRMDMTPMVDLAFLLLTFFMLTTTFNKPKAMEINMPLEGGDKVNPAVTILIGENNELCYYKDLFNPNDLSRFHKSDFSKAGIRKDLMELNKRLIDVVSEIEDDYVNNRINDSIYHLKLNAAMKEKDNEGIYVIIKATDGAKYENIVTIIDEMKICSAVNYSIIDITKEEEKVLATLY